MKILSKTTVASMAAAALLGTPATPATATASPFDPHTPDIMANHCPGGRGGYAIYWCDGLPFADGSKWHQKAYGGVFDAPYVPGEYQCVVDDGTATPPLAKPGACGGRWDGTK